MTLETVVAPSTLTPGTYLRVDLLGGSGAARTSTRRVLLVVQKSSAGTATTDTLYTDMSGADQVKTLCGPGTPAHLGAKVAFKRKSRMKMDVLVTGLGTGTATATKSFAGTATTAYNVKIEIGSATINVPWAVGEDFNTIATRVRSYINNRVADVPVAATGAAGALILTACYAGQWGNDIRVRVTLESGAGGTFDAVTTPVAYALAGGTTEPSLAAGLALVATRRYHTIVLHTSNTAASTSGASNPDTVKTHIETYKSGKNALLQTQIVGNTSAAVSSGTTGAVYRNHERTEQVFAMNARELPFEWACFEAADRADLEELRFGNPNRIGTFFSDFVGPWDLSADKPTDAEIETALAGGLSIIDYTPTGLPYLVAPVTEHSVDSSSNADSRAFWVTDVTGADTVAEDLKTALEQQFPQKKIVEDREEQDEEPLPSDTVEIREVQAFVHARLFQWVDRGTLRRDKLEEAIANESLGIEINGTDESQVDMVIPYRVVRPWSKTSLLFKRMS